MVDIEKRDELMKNWADAEHSLHEFEAQMDKLMNSIKVYTPKMQQLCRDLEDARQELETQFLKSKKDFFDFQESLD